MEIILLSIAVFIFFVGFITGGGWQLTRQEKEKEREKLKQEKCR